MNTHAIPQDVLLYTSPDGEVCLELQVKDDTVWLTQQMMADLFQTTVHNVIMHVRNIYKDVELEKDGTCKDFLQVRQEGPRQISRTITFYNLDMIISVGYRVNSKRGTQFRIWATQRLKDYLLRGVAINHKRLQQLDQTLEIMRRLENELESQQILDVLLNYSRALNWLDDYDHQTLLKPDGQTSSLVIDYEECKAYIGKMKFGECSDLFGNEKDESFAGTLGAIYQTFNGVELYPSVEEKAAYLLYFVTKNHSFTDGNKRIAAALFLYFLDKHGLLFTSTGKVIDERTLVALVIMIAESNPNEKEIMITLVMNFLASPN